MKIKFLIPVFIFVLTKIAFSEEICVYNYSFQENLQTYIFGDKVRIRKSPDIKDSNIIDQLNNGDKVTIIQKSDKSMAIDGYKESWYKINYQNNNRNSSGYVWGGFLSIGYSVKGEKLFLIGIRKYNTGTGFLAECRLVEKGRILSAVTFEPHFLPTGQKESEYGYIVSTELKDDSGLEGIENTLKIFLHYDACGYPAGNVWIGYGKDKLYYIGKDTGVSEAGVFHVEEKFIFPAEKKAGKDQVILIHESYDFDESKKDYKLTERKETKYIWKNYRLNLQK